MTITLKLGLQYPEYSHGDIVTGEVELVSTESCTVKSIQVVLRCTIHTEVQIPQSIGQGNGVVDETHCPLNIRKTVFPPENISSSSASDHYTLKAGVYKFPYHFWLPDEPVNCLSTSSNTVLNGLPTRDAYNNTENVTGTQHYCDLPPTFNSNPVNLNSGSVGFKLHLGGFREAYVSYTVQAQLNRKGIFKMRKVQTKSFVFRPIPITDLVRDSLPSFSESQSQAASRQLQRTNTDHAAAINDSKESTNGVEDVAVEGTASVSPAPVSPAPAMDEETSSVPRHSTLLHVKEHSFNHKGARRGFTCEALLQSAAFLGQDFEARIQVVLSSPSSRIPSVQNVELVLKNDISTSVSINVASTTNEYRLQQAAGQINGSNNKVTALQCSAKRLQIPKHLTTWTIPSTLSPTFNTCTIISKYRTSIIITLTGGEVCKLSSPLTLVSPNLPPFSEKENSPARDNRMNK